MSSLADVAELPERKPWTTGMAPAYIVTFLWVAWLDKLGTRALPMGGLGPSLLGVAAGAVLAYALLYRVAALWGFAAGRSLDGVAESTFGTAGARAIPNLPIALGQVILFALGIGFGTGWMLDGLRVLGLLEPRIVRPVVWGGTSIPSPLFLTTALVWGIVTALVGMGIVRWIAAIMQFFAIFPAACLALTMAGTLVGLRNFEPAGFDPELGQPVTGAMGWLRAFLTTLQWTFAFAALPALTGADWGAASLSRSDVIRGGRVGMILAPVIVASLALLAVAGQEGRLQAQAEPASELADANPGRVRQLGTAGVPLEVPGARGQTTLRGAIEGGLDRRLAAAVLLIFGLASLATACYAAFEFSRRLARIAPGISKLVWSLMGVISAWFLLIGGWHERTGVVIAILGALFAPVAGAMAADAGRSGREGWPGPRPGANRAGLLAWTAGAAVAALALAARLAGAAGLGGLAPGALLGFLTAFLAYRLAARAGLEPRAAIGVATTAAQSG